MLKLCIYIYKLLVIAMVIHVRSQDTDRPFEVLLVLISRGDLVQVSVKSHCYTNSAEKGMLNLSGEL